MQSFTLRVANATQGGVMNKKSELLFTYLTGRNEWTRTTSDYVIKAFFRYLLLTTPQNGHTSRSLVLGPFYYSILGKIALHLSSFWLYIIYILLI